VPSIGDIASTDTARIQIISAQSLNTPYSTIRYYDFKVAGFQQYRSANNLLRTFNPDFFLSGISEPSAPSLLADLGTIGSPGRPMIYQVNTSPGLDFGFHSFDHLKFHPEQTLYYDVKSPLTDIYYSVGAKEEQFFSVLHTQNINELVNAGITYQRGGTVGLYAGQGSKRVNFKGFTSIRSKDNRYHLNAQVIWNELSNEQNGGIEEDGLFEDSLSLRKNNIPMNLSTASSAENQQIYSLNQSFDFGEKSVIQVNDSVTENDFVGKLRIYHNSLYEAGAIYYSDISPTSGYYDNIYYDSLVTDNHVHYQMFTNRFGIVTVDQNPDRKKGFNMGVTGVHQYIKYNRYKKDTVTYNGMIEAFVSNSTFSRFFWKISGDYSVEGINAADYRWELSLKNSNKENTENLNFSLAVQQRAPSMINYFYEGNHYKWQNTFLKQHNATAILAYTFKRHHARLGIRGDVIGRFTYYNEIGIPQQDTNEITVSSVFAMKDFNWKNFSIKSMLQYQVVTDSAVLRLPKLISSVSIFYHNFLFKKALYMQIGLDVLFSTRYYADAYTPSTQQFHIQSEKQIGNYPYLDLFVNFKINQAKFFVKAAHVNQGYIGNTYYLVPHYPRNDMALVAGISWIFYD